MVLSLLCGGYLSAHSRKEVYAMKRAYPSTRHILYEAERPILHVSEIIPDAIPSVWHDLQRAMLDEHLTPSEGMSALPQPARDTGAGVPVRDPAAS